MQLLGMLLPLFSLIAFVAFIWLVVVAFRCSTMWGVLVLLFSPISAIIFAIKYWGDAKKPFLTYVGCVAASFAAMLTMLFWIGSPMIQMAAEMQDGEMDDAQALNLMEKTMDRMENSGMLSAEDEAELRKMRETMVNEMKQDMEKDAEPTADTTVMSTAVPRERIIEDAAGRPAADTSTGPVELTSVTGTGIRDFIPLTELKSHSGKKLRVVTNDGNEFLGRFIEESGGDLQFERRLPAGTFAVYLPRSSVRSVHPVKAR